MKFDLHVHSEKSKDSSLSPDDLYTAAKRAGLSGVAVTDHNLYLDYPQLEDLIIIPAAEYSTDCGHLLVYFLKEPLENTLSKNELGIYPWRQVIDAAHAQGAIVFLAHPFSPKIFRDIDTWKAVDGVEIYNSRVEHSRIKDANLSAQTTCLLLGKPFSAGSDAHFAGEIGRAFWECDDFDLTGMTRTEAQDAIKQKLMSGTGVVFCGAASPFYRVRSHYITAVKERKPMKLIRVFALLIYTAFISLLGLTGIAPTIKSGYLDGWSKN
jgi:predicted metal-dependent phosphoesterase TrpH